MTVLANDSQISITATGGETSLDFDFLIYADTDLLVRKRAVDGTLTTLALTTDYTVPSGSINDESGGNINLVVAATAGEVYTLAANIAETRTADYQQAGDLRAATLNGDFDKLVRLVQQLRRDVDSKIGVPTGGLNIDADGAKIVNLGAATDPSDALTVAGAQSLISASGNVPAFTSSQYNYQLVADNSGSAAWYGGSTTIASASTVDLAAATTPNIIITGTTTITDFGSPTGSFGLQKTIVFIGSMTLTHGATSIILPNSANLQTASGDVAVFYFRGAALGWRCVSYTRATGEPIALNMPFGQCRLTKSGANLLLSPYNGNRLFINGQYRTIPSGGVTLAPTSTTANTTYYIYAYWTGSAIALEYSTTARATDTTYGHQIKNGDATRTLVGMARAITGSAWQDTAEQRFIISWFNRLNVIAQNNLAADATTSSLTWVEMNSAKRAEFITFSECSCDTSISGIAYTSTGAGSVSMTFDGTTPELGVSQHGTSSTNIGQRVQKSLSEGYHYATISGKKITSGSLTVNGSSDWLTTIIVTVKG